MKLKAAILMIGLSASYGAIAKAPDASPVMQSRSDVAKAPAEASAPEAANADELISKSPTNPISGEPIAVEKLKRILTYETISAQISEQKVKRAQADKQYRDTTTVVAAPAPPKERKEEKPVPAKAPQLKSTAVDAQRSLLGSGAVAPASPLVSPVAGISVVNGTYYAVLQLGGRGGLARAGETFAGRRVDAVSADSVTLDGVTYRSGQGTLAQIANSDPESMPTVGARGYTPMPGGPLPPGGVAPPPLQPLAGAVPTMALQ